MKRWLIHIPIALHLLAHVALGVGLLGIDAYTHLNHEERPWTTPPSTTSFTPSKTTTYTFDNFVTTDKTPSCVTSLKSITASSPSCFAQSSSSTTASTTRYLKIPADHFLGEPNAVNAIHEHSSVKITAFGKGNAMK